MGRTGLLGLKGCIPISVLCIHHAVHPQIPGIWQNKDTSCPYLMTRDPSCDVISHQDIYE